MLTIQSIAVTHVGKVREHNEDSIYINDNNGLWLVADGMGGHASGDVASKVAVATVAEKIQKNEMLADAITFAHQSILQQGQQNPEQNGMGTTIVAAQLIGSGFNIAWVGDSRIYSFNGTLSQLTVDHTFVQDMVYRQVLTLEEAQNHPNSHLINRCLGNKKSHLKVDSKKTFPARDGYLFLCSDGVSDYLSAAELNKIFENAQSLQNIGDAIEKNVLASEAGDNFSFIILEYKLSFWAKLKNYFKADSK